MKNRSLTLLALALVFISVMLLTAAIQYSSGLIDVRSQPAPAFGSDINITGQLNRTDTGASSATNNDRSVRDNGSDMGLSRVPDLKEILTPLGIKPDIIDDPPDYLLIVIAILVALLLALIGYILWRRRKRGLKKPAAADVEEVEARAVLEYFEGDYKISFPQISAPFPVIWGVNERLDVVIQDKTGKNSDMALYVDGKVAREVTADHGAARLWLDLDKGDHRIMVSPKNSPGSSGSSWTDVRIVDYREEIVRIFNEMYREYRSSHESAGDEMTARELEIAMRQEVPEHVRKKLGETIRLFEYANYSLHDVRRKDFEEMYLSRADMTPAAGGQNVG